MSATEDVARMLTLVPWLLERPGAGIDEIAETFGVSARQVRADLGHLDFCGLPGLGGGDLFEVSVVGDRVVLQMADELRRPLRPTASEALRLVLTVDAVADALGDEVPALESAVAEIRRALGIPRHVADVVGEAGPQVLSTCRAAVRTGRVLHLSYQGRGDEVPRRRVVHPWALHVVDGVWYLQGHDEDAGDGRTFHLGRIASAQLTDAPRSVEAPAHLEPPRYVPGPEDLEVRLEVAPSARWFLDAVVVDEVHDADDGALRVLLHTDAPDWLAHLVVMAGGGVRVTAPEDLAARVAAIADDALGRYRTAGGEPVP